MRGGQGGCNRGRHKIYVAFTVEQVVKCNYRGGRHTAEPQPSRQTGRKARRQVIKAYSSTLSLCLSLLSFILSFSLCLQTHKSAATSPSFSVKTAEPSDMKCFTGTIWCGRRLTNQCLCKKTQTERRQQPSDFSSLDVCHCWKKLPHLSTSSFVKMHCL